MYQWAAKVDPQVVGGIKFCISVKILVGMTLCIPAWAFLWHSISKTKSAFTLPTIPTFALVTSLYGKDCQGVDLTSCPGHTVHSLFEL